MVQIVLITAANRQIGQVQKASLLGYRAMQWCKEKLKLKGDPIPLETKIELLPNKGHDQHVFVKVGRNGNDMLEPGWYPSDETPTKVRELLKSDENIAQTER